MRRFELHRHTDITGISGTGKVAEGVWFSNGKTVINWLTDKGSVVVWDNYADAFAIHGHGGATSFVFLDEEG